MTIISADASWPKSNGRRRDKKSKINQNVIWAQVSGQDTPSQFISRLVTRRKKKQHVYRENGWEIRRRHTWEQKYSRTNWCVTGSRVCTEADQSTWAHRTHEAGHSVQTSLSCSVLHAFCIPLNQRCFCVQTDFFQRLRQNYEELHKAALVVPGITLTYVHADTHTWLIHSFIHSHIHSQTHTPIHTSVSPSTFCHSRKKKKKQYSPTLIHRSQEWGNK